jgi:hypothetical protein
MKLRPIDVCLLLSAFIGTGSQRALPVEPIREGQIRIEFASVELARTILTARDDFVTRMSAFDRSARMKTADETSEQQYLDFVAANAVAWTDEEQARVRAAWESVQPSIANFGLSLADAVVVIKTTGAEEGGAAYTRDRAIVLPQSMLASPPDRLRQVLSHELFHILSRANPRWRDRLYAAIGFERCDEIVLPTEWAQRKITNPDAPVNDHCIRLEHDGQPIWVVPVLISKTAAYDPTTGGEFFDYLQFKFLAVERSADLVSVKPVIRDGQLVMFELEQLAGFFEQIGRNTSYIIHPEEILADNFALLVAPQRELASPQIAAKIQAILMGSAEGH